MITDEQYANRCKKGWHCTHVVGKWPAILGQVPDGPRGYEYRSQCCHCGEVFVEVKLWGDDDRHGKWYRPDRYPEYSLKL
jgi:hypothetical protein